MQINEQTVINCDTIMSEDVAVRINDNVKNSLGQTIVIEDTSDEEEQISPDEFFINVIRFDDDDDLINQKNSRTEHISNSDTNSTTPDHDDVEYISTSIEHYDTEDVKFKAMQEIVTPDNVTNIETMCRSKSAKNVAVNSINIEVSGTNQGSAIKTTVIGEKYGDVFIGEISSDNDNVPLSETIREVKRNATVQVTGAHDSLPLEVDFYRLSCHLCPFVSKNKSSMLFHAKAHNATKRFNCQMCNYISVHKKQLENHIYHTHSNKKPYSCDLCHKKFVVEEDLQSHLKIHKQQDSGANQDSASKTTVIGEKNGDVFIGEISSDDDDLSLAETREAKRSATAQATRAHDSPVEVDFYKMSCHLCPFVSKNKLSMSFHAKAHNATKRFNCQMCSYISVRKRQLESHIYHSHSNIKPYSCDLCHKQFVVEEDLQSHLKICKPSTCKLCQKTFCTKQLLRDHMFTHYGKFPCHLCNRVFLSNKFLKRHIKKKVCGKSFSCEICQKTFIHRWRLEAHMPIHYDEKRFTCDICGSKFKRKGALPQHIRSHFEETVKSFSCGMCRKKFYSEMHLMIHIRSIHSTVKPTTPDYDDMECISTSIEDYDTEDVKFKVMQEIVTPDNFTNIETMCRSKSPKDVSVNSINIEDSGANQDSASKTTVIGEKHGDVL